MIRFGAVPIDTVIGATESPCTMYLICYITPSAGATLAETPIVYYIICRKINPVHILGYVEHKETILSIFESGVKSCISNDVAVY